MGATLLQLNEERPPTSKKHQRFPIEIQALSSTLVIGAINEDREDALASGKKEWITTLGTLMD